jgi:hypothetical protein
MQSNPKEPPDENPLAGMLIFGIHGIETICLNLLSSEIFGQPERVC